MPVHRHFTYLFVAIQNTRDPSIKYVFSFQVSRDYDEEEQLGYDGEDEKGKKKEKEDEDTKDKGETVDMDISDSP